MSTIDSVLRNVTIGDPDGEVRDILTTEDAQALLDLARAGYRQLEADGHRAAATYLLATLLSDMANRVAEIDEAERDARIQREANGHEVWVTEDRDGWLPSCWCVTDDFEGIDPYPDRDGAAAAAEAHATAHGGRWSDVTD